MDSLRLSRLLSVAAYLPFPAVHSPVVAAVPVPVLVLVLVHIHIHHNPSVLVPAAAAAVPDRPHNPADPYTAVAADPDIHHPAAVDNRPGAVVAAAAEAGREYSPSPGPEPVPPALPAVLYRHSWPHWALCYDAFPDSPAPPSSALSSSRSGRSPCSHS